MIDALPIVPIVRRATEADMPIVLELRKRFEREFVGRVPIPMNVVWIVAEYGGVIHACAGGAFAQNDFEGKPVCIVTDLYDDGSFAGKRCLSAIIEDANVADVELYINVAFDRPGLKDALEKRGMEVTSWQMQKRRHRPGSGRQRP